MQSGISGLALDTTEVAIQHLTSPSRPPKRPYTEVADSEDEEHGSDDYGWVEEDELATEGLVTDEAPLVGPGTGAMQP